MDFSAQWFFDLDARLRAAGLDSDAQSFDEIYKTCVRVQFMTQMRLRRTVRM